MYIMMDIEIDEEGIFHMYNFPNPMFPLMGRCPTSRVSAKAMSFFWSTLVTSEVRGCRNFGTEPLGR
jgi:hypothetical protein